MNHDPNEERAAEPSPPAQKEEVETQAAAARPEPLLEVGPDVGELIPPRKTPAARVNSRARSITSVIFAVAGVAFLFMHPDRYWEGIILAFVGAGVVSPEILEGLTKHRR